jgi:hypothetical protein
MNPSLVLLLSFLIGVIAGLRTMTAPAVVAWAANRHWLNLDNSPLALMGSIAAVVVFTLGALGELVIDKLPSTAKTHALRIAESNNDDDRLVLLGATHREAPKGSENLIRGTRLKPRHNNKASSNRYRVFEESDDEVRNLQRAHEALANFVAGKRARDRTGHAKNGACCDRLCPGRRDCRAGQSAEHTAANEPQKSCAVFDRGG